MKIREENAAIIEAVTQRFDYSEVAFYWSIDLDTLTRSPNRNEYLFDESYLPFDIIYPDQSTFVLVHHEPGETFPEEIVVRKTTKRGSDLLSTRDQFNTYAKRKAWGEQRQIELRSRMDSLQSITTKSLEQQNEIGSQIAQAKEEIEALDDYFESISFMREYEYYSAENESFANLLIRRIKPIELVRNKRKTYYINYNYTARIHGQVDLKTAYDEAFQHLQLQLTEKQKAILEKLESKERLKSAR
ncbi:MAG: hypothetical protein HKN32_06295 [Flavobacteriales bacterium]|nr:hypothetical protein [Flavobacteriales bacterium]